MNNIIAGNIFSLLATATDLYSAYRKTTRSILLAQTASQCFLGASSLVLGGYSAVVQNIVSVIRNITAMGKRTSKAVEYLLIVLGVALGIGFNNLGAIGWLPVVANLEYSIAVFRFKENERRLKAAFSICIALYFIFNVFISNYVGAASNFIVLATTFLALLKGQTRSKKQANSKE